MIAFGLAGDVRRFEATFDSPSVPWHAWHISAFARPAATSAPTATPETSNAATAPARARAIVLRYVTFAVVPDAIERSDEIVRDEQRTVVQLRHVDRTTQVIAVVVPPFGKRLGFPGDVTIVVFEERHHHAGADRHGSIPRTVLRREDRALILFRKHAARVEHQTEVCRMSGLLDLREDHVGRRRIVLVLVGARLAAASTTGKPKSWPALAMRFISPGGWSSPMPSTWLSLVQSDLVLRVEVHADRIAQVRSRRPRGSCRHGPCG